MSSQVDIACGVFRGAQQRILLNTGEDVFIEQQAFYSLRALSVTRVSVLLDVLLELLRAIDCSFHRCTQRLQGLGVLICFGQRWAELGNDLVCLEDGVLRCLVAPSGGGDGLQCRQVLGGRRRWGRRGRGKTEAFARRRSVHECTQTVTRRQRRARHGSTCMPPGRPCEPRRWPRQWRLRPRRRPGCTLLQRQRGVPVRSPRSPEVGKWSQSASPAPSS